MTLACVALVRRPGLMDALDSKYCSTIDSFLIRTDCDVMMPALPALDRLANAVYAVEESDCQGTARFGFGRDYNNILVAIRLHRSDLWNWGDRDSNGISLTNHTDVAKEKSKKSHFRARNRALIHDLMVELARYYSDYFAVPLPAAEKEAGMAVSAAIFGPYDFC